MLLTSSLAAGLPPDAILLPALAAALPTGVVCAAPQHAATGDLVDFTLAYLNPAAQRLLGLATAPAPATFAQLLPAHRPADQLAQLTAAYQAPPDQLISLAAPALGLPASLRATGQRVGEHLLLLLTPAEVAAPSAQITRLRQQRDAAHADAEGQVEGVMTFAVEVTAQLRARQQVEQLNHALEARVQERTAQLTQQATRLERLVQEAPTAIALLDGPELVFELLNADYQALFPDRQLVGQPVLAALPELLDTPLAEVLRQVYRTGVTYRGHEVPIPFRPADGRLEYRYFDFIYQARHTVDGVVDGLVIFGFEVTERVLGRQQVEQLNQELQAQQVLLARILEQVPAFIATLSGPEHRFSFFNAPYQQVLAGRVELGRTVAEVMPEVVEQGFIGLLDQVYVTGRPFVGTATPAQLYDPQRQASRLYYVDLLYQPLVDAQQQVQGILAFLVDVTDRTLARQQVEQLNQALSAGNDELRRSNAKLRRANQDLDNFVYSASHDLKAPIVNLEGLLRVLGEETATGHWSELAAYVLTLMQAAVTRFLTTLGHLTEVMHAEQDDAPSVQVDVARLIADVQLDLTALAASTQAQVSVEVGACPTLLVPAKTLRSVVYNLLSNALKYRHPDRPPRVRFHCQQDAHQTRLEVQDNGLGLDVQQQAELFGLFRRHHPHVEGSGVGLYSVKRQVEHAGGRIEVRSHVGEGSTFIVTFPLHATQVG